MWLERAEAGDIDGVLALYEPVGATSYPLKSEQWLTVAVIRIMAVTESGRQGKTG